MKKRIRSWTLRCSDISHTVGVCMGWRFGDGDWFGATTTAGLLLVLSLCYNRVIGDYP